MKEKPDCPFFDENCIWYSEFNPQDDYCQGQDKYKCLIPKNKRCTNIKDETEIFGD